MFIPTLDQFYLQLHFEQLAWIIWYFYWYFLRLSLKRQESTIGLTAWSSYSIRAIKLVSIVEHYQEKQIRISLLIDVETLHFQFIQLSLWLGHRISVFNFLINCQKCWFLLELRSWSFYLCANNTVVLLKQ